MISSETIKLPANLKYGYDENVDKIYWAASIELSKAIDMDFSNLLSEEITVEIYYLLQPLPSFCKPYTEARGVVIRHKDKIVGAYIQGNNNIMISTLNKQSFEQVIYMSMNDWIVKNVLDEDSELYKESVTNYISKLEIIDINKSENDSNKYHVEIDIISTKDASVEKGKQIRTVMMTKTNGVSKIKEEVSAPQ